MRRKGGHVLAIARSTVKDMPEESPGGEVGVTSIVPGLKTSGQDEDEGVDRLGTDPGCWELLSPTACPLPRSLPRHSSSSLPTPRTLVVPLLPSASLLGP